MVTSGNESKQQIYLKKKVWDNYAKPLGTNLWLYILFPVIPDWVEGSISTKIASDCCTAYTLNMISKEVPYFGTKTAIKFTHN